MARPKSTKATQTTAKATATKKQETKAPVEAEATQEQSQDTVEMQSHYQPVPEPTNAINQSENVDETTQETTAVEADEKTSTTSEADPVAQESNLEAINDESVADLEGIADLETVLEAAQVDAESTTHHEGSNKDADLLVLEVKVKSPKKTFWRCGRCWSAEGSQVLVVDNVEKAESDIVARDDKWQVFISKQDHKRLLQEPWLEVTEVEL